MSPKKTKSKSRYEGDTPHEMIENSLLFGVDRYTRTTADLCDRIDVFCGVDPKISQHKRDNRLAGRAILQKMGGWNVPIPPAAKYAQGLKSLISHKYIERRKSKQGFKMTKKGKATVKEMEKPWFRKSKV